MDFLKLATLVIFIACYALVLWRKVKIAYISIASAALLVLIGSLAPSGVLDAIKWDVLGIYWGFMMVSIVFAESGVPAHLAKAILHRTKSEGKALLALCGLTASLSCFMENVGVVLMMAPIGFEMARRAGSSPFVYLISIACSSNIVTTVTMVADPPALILAGETGMTFLDFYWFHNRIGLGTISIFAIVAGLAALYFVNLRGMKKGVKIKEEKIEIAYAPTALFVGGVLALAISPYIAVRIGVVGLIVGLIALALGLRHIKKMIVNFDWNSFFFIMGIFVVIGAVNAMGILHDLATGLVGLGLNNPVIALAFLTWLSVALSSFIDNVPFTVLMIPVCVHMANAIGMSSAFPLLYGMLVGTGIGGNITPVGATANVFACGLLEKRGHKIRLKEFMRIGVPMSVSAVLVAHILLQLLWM